MRSTGVDESAVIGVPDADFGEAVVAIVVAEPGATLDDGVDPRRPPSPAWPPSRSRSGSSSSTRFPATSWARSRSTACAARSERRSPTDVAAPRTVPNRLAGRRGGCGRLADHVPQDRRRAHQQPRGWLLDLAGRRSAAAEGHPRRRTPPHQRGRGRRAAGRCRDRHRRHDRRGGAPAQGEEGRPRSARDHRLGHSRRPARHHHARRQGTGW